MTYLRFLASFEVQVLKDSGWELAAKAASEEDAVSIQNRLIRESPGRVRILERTAVVSAPPQRRKHSRA